MITGYNHNIRHNNRVYHVQTEDSGRQYAHIITHLFVGGNIISSKKSSYQEILSKNLEDAALEDAIREQMKEQHKNMIRELKAGDHDAVGEFKTEGTLLTPGLMQRSSPLVSSASLPTLDPSALAAASAALQKPTPSSASLPTLDPSALSKSAAPSKPTSPSAPAVAPTSTPAVAPTSTPGSSGASSKPSLLPSASASASLLSSAPAAHLRPSASASSPSTTPPTGLPTPKDASKKDLKPTVSGDTYETVLTVEDMMEEEDFVQLTKQHNFTQKIAAFRPIPSQPEPPAKPSSLSPSPLSETPPLDDALHKAFAEMDALLGPPSEALLSTPFSLPPNPAPSAFSPPPPSASADSLEIPLEPDDMLEDDSLASGDPSQRSRARINRERPSFRAPRPPKPKAPPRTSVPETRTDEDLPQFQPTPSISAASSASDLPWKNLLASFLSPSHRSSPSLEAKSSLLSSPWKVQIHVAPTSPSLPRPADSRPLSEPLASLLRSTLQPKTPLPPVSPGSPE